MTFAPKTFLISFLGMKSSRLPTSEAVFSAGIQFSFTLWEEKKVNLIIIIILSIARQPCGPKENS